MKSKVGFVITIILPQILFAQSWTNYTEADGLSNNHVQAVAIDVAGNMWFGTKWGGVSKFDGTNWTTFNELNSDLVDDNVMSIFIDSSSGIIWFGTAFGISSYDGTNWTSYTQAGNLIHAIAKDHSGHLWFGNLNGVAEYDGTNWESHSANVVFSVVIDSAGNIWIGSASGVLKFDGVNWTNYLPDSDILCISIDPVGNLWFGTEYDGAFEYDGTNWIDYTTADGLCYKEVYSIMFDSLGNTWFSTRNGISKLKDGQWTTYTANDGLAANWVMSSIIDAQGNLWFGTAIGVSKYSETVNAIDNNIPDNHERLYPNPASDMVTIPDEPYTTDIYNLRGEKVLSSTGERLDVTRFSAGIYLVLSKDAKGNLVRREKLIIE